MPGSPSHDPGGWWGSPTGPMGRWPFLGLRRPAESGGPLLPLRGRICGDRNAWLRLSPPQTPGWSRSTWPGPETVRWRSDDGTEIEGLVVFPLDYDPSRRYPLITEIPRGPACGLRKPLLPTAAAPHRAYGHLLAARGYAFFLPNLPGARPGYGGTASAPKIAGGLTGPGPRRTSTRDRPTSRGGAWPTRTPWGFMGVVGGGTLVPTGLLVTTDRFRPSSSGAGWPTGISLYAQTDNQSSRGFLPRAEIPRWVPPTSPGTTSTSGWYEAPLKYIENASTPTLLHYGELDRASPCPRAASLQPVR